MGTGAETFLVVVLWAIPIVVGVVLMIQRYEPPPEPPESAGRPEARR